MRHTIVHLYYVAAILERDRDECITCKINIDLVAVSRNDPALVIRDRHEKARAGRCVTYFESAVAVTDIGFAEAFVKLLSADDPERYGDAAQELERRHEKMQRRKKEKGTKGQAKTIGKRRTNI